MPVYTAAVTFISTCIADTCTIVILGVHLAKLLKRSKETPVTRVAHMPRTVDFPWVGARQMVRYLLSKSTLHQL